MTLRVEYAPEATADLLAIFNLIAVAAGPERAEAYVLRIERRCEVLATFPFAGSAHGDVVPGLRSLAFERRVRIGYRVEPGAVRILRVLYAGKAN